MNQFLLALTAMLLAPLAALHAADPTSEGPSGFAAPVLGALHHTCQRVAL